MRAFFLVISLLFFTFPLLGYAQTAEFVRPAKASTRLLADEKEVAPLEHVQECPQCPELVILPTGAFMMGAKPGESRNRFSFMFYEDFEKKAREIDPKAPIVIPTEQPRHRVEIDIPFAMGRNEVTHAEWMACVAAGACAHTPDHRVFTKLKNGRLGYVDLGPDHPVINVSYQDVQHYIAWLNSLVGADVYRLPTEAEWEYAARAGTTSRFAQGDDLTSDQANFSRGATENNRQKPMPELTNRGIPVPVEELDAANGWGLRHMSGNVEEMTRSCWSDTHLGLETSSAYLSLSEQQRSCKYVTKGGSFTDAMDIARPAKRGRIPETYRSKDRGFRLIRQLKIERDKYGL